MFRNAQIAQTMNWVIATIIIVVIMTISFFISDSAMLNSGKWDLPDKQKDFVATKSIVNFVGINEELIRSSIINEDYSEFDKKLLPFLESLFTEVCENNLCKYRGIWALGGEHPSQIVNIDTSVEKYDVDNYPISFIFLINDEQKKLTFWENLWKI